MSFATFVPAQYSSQRTRRSNLGRRVAPPTSCTGPLGSGRTKHPKARDTACACIRSKHCIVFEPGAAHLRNESVRLLPNEGESDRLASGGTHVKHPVRRFEAKADRRQ
jgi:hypothetical protein